MNHLVRIGDWPVWRLTALRSAGFPAQHMELLLDADLATAAATAEPRSKEFEQAYVEASARLSGRLRDLAADTRFREAVAWQSPHLLATCVDKVAQSDVPVDRVPGSKHRQRQLTIASYLQRYTLKNDSIGFFGPVGWATWTEIPEGMRAVPGPDLLSRRTVYFETWAVDAVARSFSRDEQLIPWLRPRLAPQNLVDSEGVLTPRGKRIALSAGDSELLARCDGIRTVAEIAAGIASVPDVHARLLSLQEREFVRVELEVHASAHPEAQLRAFLELVPTSHLGKLDDLEAARDAVARAAGDPDKLIAALEALDAIFVELTGQHSARRAGETYAGRTLVYEDTVRAVDVELGEPVKQALAAPLDLLLRSAAWLVATAAEAYRARFDEIFDRQCARTGETSATLAALYSAATPDMVFSFRELPPLVDDVVAEFQRKWQRILAVPTEGSRHQVSAAEITEAVHREFGLPDPPWSAAVHHAPDVMIAATDQDAVDRGEFLVVLGELHAGMNTIESRLFVEQSPSPAAMMAADEADHGTRRINMLLSKESGKVNSRTTPSALLSDQYTYWALYPDGANSGEGAIPAAALRVHREDGVLRVRSSVDNRTFDLLEVFGEALASAIMNGFSLLPSSGYRPRITIDRMVVAREAWKFDVSALDWAHVNDPAERYRQAWHWHRERNLPQRCFYRVPVEDKPLFVDFSSIALVEMLARSIRRTVSEGDTTTLSLSEMLPDLHETWLRDADGNRYTSELRIVAVHPGGSSYA